MNALGLGLSTVDLEGNMTLSVLRGEFSRRGIDVGAGRHNVYGLASPELDFAGRLIGIADDWDGRGGGKKYVFNGSGPQLIKLELKGYRTAWVKITVTPEDGSSTADR